MLDEMGSSFAKEYLGKLYIFTIGEEFKLKF
jgi:hypothetical protein